MLAVEENIKRLTLHVRKWVYLNTVSLIFMFMVTVLYCAFNYYLLKEVFFIYFVSALPRRSHLNRERAFSHSRCSTPRGSPSACAPQSPSSSSGNPPPPHQPPSE